jgi:tetratricopeptide (TPR) repeat protein
MAQVVQMENDLPRAQSMLEQYLQHWVGDARTPEIFLHQGRIFRQMGLHTYALSKFYAVSTTALSLKNDQLAYYKKLVLTAQLEIAETEFVQGHYKGAAEFYSRMLDQNAPGLDRAQVQFRLVRALSGLHQNAETVKQAKDFLERYKDSLDEPEARYHLAQALKGQNRNADALQQVMFFLQEQREKTKDRPEVWAYWQQRVGNEIGNQLYQDGDYIRALEVYLALSKLDGAPAWQLPVRYQVGITYEKLLQPKLATVAYRAITNAAPQLGTNLTPGLKSVVDMAQWRLDFLQWHERAEEFTRPVDQPPAGTNTDLTQNEHR